MHIGGGGTAVLEAVGAAELATLVAAAAEETIMEDENWHKFGHCRNQAAMPR